MPRRCWRGRVPEAHGPAIPLDQQRLPRFRRLSRGAQFTQAQGGQEGAARGAGAGGLEIDVLTGADLTATGMGRVLPASISRTSDRKWGSAYLNRKFFALIGERMADKVVLVMARHGAGIRRRRVQHPRPRDDLRPQLGQLRRLPVPAFRVLLLPGDRVRDRPRAEAGRGRRPGPAQTAARLSAGADLQRPLDPRPRLPPRRRRSSSPASARWSSRRSSTWPNTRRSGRKTPDER